MPTESLSLDQSLARLRSQAELLLRRSDDLNRLLADVESTLRESLVRIDVTIHELVAAQENAEGDGVEGFFFGWAEMREGWCLVARPVAASYADGADKNATAEFEPTGPDIALRRASRKLRIAAVPILSQLVAVVSKAVGDRLAAFAPIEHLLPQADYDPEQGPLLTDDDLGIGRANPDEIPF